jgi:GntR family transcriptional regulator/MocR family aminotransferase
VVLLDIAVDRASAVPLQRQVYLGIRRLILTGRLKPGALLPSTRYLASELRVARTTVLDAFGQLIFEGYLQGKVGSGTRVSSHVPDDVQALALITEQYPVASLHRKPRIARRTAPYALQRVAKPIRPLRPGLPDIESLPLDTWSRLTAKHWRRAASQFYDHADSLGYLPLRKAICDYVSGLRGVRCEPEQVIITAGAQQALYLCAKTLLDPGQSVWMEDPGYPRARMAFGSAQLKVVPVPVDLHGMNPAAALKKSPSPLMIYVTPSFQCPLGYAMSLERRFDVLRIAAKSNAWILEDDYFSEFRYGTGPVASLQSLDRNERVIYIGNFSKNIVPFLRIGFLIAPKTIVHLLRLARTSVSRQPPGIDQAALAEFIADGHLQRHIRVTLQIYRERRQALVDAIRQYGRGVLDVSDEGGVGMYLVGWLPAGMDDRSAAQIAAAAGVQSVPLSNFAHIPIHRLVTKPKPLIASSVLGTPISAFRNPTAPSVTRRVSCISVGSWMGTQYRICGLALLLANRRSARSERPFASLIPS